MSAWFAGIVHGVVVQMTASAGPAGSAASAERRRELVAVGVVERKRDVDRDVVAVLVFDFRFGERAAAVEAPVHRLQAAIDEALLQQLAQRADLVGLVPVRHRRVRMVPVAEHAEALEVRLLPHDLLVGVGAREAAAFPRPGCACRAPSRSAPRSACRGSPSPARTARRSRRACLLLTTTSFRILLTAWPMWMSLFAYGGPSCSTKRGRPADAARIAS